MQPNSTGTGTKKLFLKVKGKPRTGRRSCIKVTARDEAGQAVPGVTVRLGDNTRITKLNGRARICRRFKKAGKLEVSAQKAGYEGAETRVKVRQPNRSEGSRQGRTRTGDPFITNEVLYQLSYLAQHR